MNNKGFMMAEVVVVSAIVMVTLVAIYVSYNKIFTLYNQRIDYYDATTLYKLGEIRDNSHAAELMEWKTRGISKEPYSQADLTLYYTTKDDIVNKQLETAAINKTYQEYLEYLSDGVELRDDVYGYLILENCGKGIDNCKYAYLEVFEDETTPE